MRITNRKIKKDILSFLKTNNGAFYGDLIEHLDYSAQEIVANLMALKQKGRVFKDDDGGRFKAR